MKNVISELAKAKHGSVYKLIKDCGLKPSTAYPALNGHRKPWPALRHQLASALEVKESEIFNSDGWPILETKRANGEA